MTLTYDHFTEKNFKKTHTKLLEKNGYHPTVRGCSAYTTRRKTSDNIKIFNKIFNK